MKKKPTILDEPVRYLTIEEHNELLKLMMQKCYLEHDKWIEKFNENNIYSNVDVIQR